jgi:hypothetical protein
MMKTAKRLAGGLLLALCLVSSKSFAVESLPTFQEVYELLRTNPPGLSAEEFNRAALGGLVRGLDGRVILPMLETNSPSGTSSVAQATVLDNGFAWIRLGQIDDRAAAQIGQAWSGLASSNRLRGLILDLRGASGQDYAAAAAVADKFLASELPLLIWAGGKATSTIKTNAWLKPVAVLVNEQTSASAEALAAVLRQSRVALVLGQPTAGRARTMKEFRLSNGQPMWIASEPVRLGDGLPLDEPVKPDITVPTSREQELQWLDDPFRKAGAAAKTIVSSAARRRINEAELVRQQREGKTPDEEFTAEPAASKEATEPEKPVVQDPVLARALDLLKGLAVIQPQRGG